MPPSRIRTHAVVQRSPRKLPPLPLTRSLRLLGVASAVLCLGAGIASGAAHAATPTGGAAAPRGSAPADRGVRTPTPPAVDRDAGDSRPSARPSGGAAVPPPGARTTRPPSAREDRDDNDRGSRRRGDRDRSTRGSRPPREPRNDGAPGAGVADIPSEYLELYRTAATVADVSWRLVAAVGKNESDHGRSTLPGIRSGVNAAKCCSGPMQICTVKSCGNTWDAYARDGDGDGVKSPYAAADAIHAAATLLHDLRTMFGNHPAYILAGYNAGAGNVQKHRGVPPFAETEAYVKRGLDYMRTLRR